MQFDNNFFSIPASRVRTHFCFWYTCLFFPLLLSSPIFDFNWEYLWGNHQNKECKIVNNIVCPVFSDNCDRVRTTWYSFFEVRDNFVFLFFEIEKANAQSKLEIMYKKLPILWKFSFRIQDKLVYILNFSL